MLLHRARSALTSVEAVLQAHNIDTSRYYIPQRARALALPEALVEAAPSAWDPEEDDDSDIDALLDDTSLEEADEDPAVYRVLLLNVIRRAQHDYVLYKNSSNPSEKRIAHEAYVWLFKEDYGHPNYLIRKRSGTTITAFLDICHVMSLDPEYIRECTRALTPRHIKTAGRPAEVRKGAISSSYVEHSFHGTSYESLGV